MKKISLEMLRLSSDEVLERSQMKKITGGYGAHNWQCQCWWSTGQWTGYYSSATAAQNSITTWCASGMGSCQRI